MRIRAHVLPARWKRPFVKEMDAVLLKYEMAMNSPIPNVSKWTEWSSTNHLHRCSHLTTPLVPAIPAKCSVRLPELMRVWLFQILAKQYVMVLLPLSEASNLAAIFWILLKLQNAIAFLSILHNGHYTVWTKRLYCNDKLQYVVLAHSYNHIISHDI